MGLNKKLRSLEQTRINLSHLLREFELPKIKEDLRKQWEKAQLEKKNKVGGVSKFIGRIFGRKK